MRQFSPYVASMALERVVASQCGQIQDAVQRIQRMQNALPHKCGPDGKPLPYYSREQLVEQVKAAKKILEATLPDFDEVIDLIENYMAGGAA